MMNVSKQSMRWWMSVWVLGLLAACSQDDPGPARSSTEGEWAIPRTQVFDGGPGKDGIPSIDRPVFGSIASETANVSNDELVVVVKAGDQVRAYPHNILDWHEIVNDAFDQGLNLALTYCPLTGTAIGWDREVDGSVTTFGVSGLLYNSNLIPYDRNTDSYWSQMLNLGVRGQHLERGIVTYPVSEMTFGAFKSAFPDGVVLTQNTGFDRRYGFYPYGSYLSVESTLFPVSREDRRIFGKERVLGIQHEGITRVYQLTHFEDTHVLLDEIDGASVVIFGSESQGFANGYFSRELNGETIRFQSTDGESGVVATDQFGNQWNLFGEAISGPDAGEVLTPTASYIGFYFAWVAFNEEVEIFEAEN